MRAVKTSGVIPCAVYLPHAFLSVSCCISNLWSSNISDSDFVPPSFDCVMTTVSTTPFSDGRKSRHGPSMSAVFFESWRTRIKILRQTVDSDDHNSLYDHPCTAFGISNVHHSSRISGSDRTITDV